MIARRNPMQGCPVVAPGAEQRRLEELRSLRLESAPPSAHLEALAAGLAEACEAPVAMLSVVDESRQWCAASAGWTGPRELPRAESFCSMALAAGAPMEVADAAADARFAALPLVRDLGIRFYAGHVVTGPTGQALGTLCVMDRRPRTLDARQRRLLALLAAVAARELGGQHLRRELDRARAALAELDARVESLVQLRTRAVNETLTELEWFAHGVSHEFAPHVRFLGGLAQAAFESLGEAESAEARRHIARLGEGVAGLAELLESMRRLAGATREPMHRASFPVEEVVREAWDSLPDDAARRRTRLEVGPLPTAWADRILLRQAFVNLLGNAVKFSAGSACPAVAVSWDGTSLRVSDNGVGFAMAQARALFAPFTRLHSRARFPGTGLGLATVERIVRRHGGSLRAFSEEGRGATFAFTLAGEPRAGQGG